MFRNSTLVQYITLFLKEAVIAPWIFIWLWLGGLAFVILRFLQNPFRYDLDSSFLAYNNNPENIQQLLVLQATFVACLFCISFTIKHIRSSINIIIVGAVLCTLCAYTWLMYPLMASVLFAVR
jgi:hypothetical protein